jgi:hypothetical protein
MTGPHANSVSVIRVAADRKLTLSVPLGPSNQYQAETPQAAAGTAVYTTYVKVKRLRERSRTARRSP